MGRIKSELILPKGYRLNPSSALHWFPKNGCEIPNNERARQRPKKAAATEPMSTRAHEEQ